MQIPKLSLKSGLWASVAVLSIALSVPFLYNKFGEGPATARNEIRSSEILGQLCGPVKTLIFVPFNFAYSDQDNNVGTLDISYWAKCQRRFETVRANLVEKNGQWSVHSLLLVRRNLPDLSLITVEPTVEHPQ